jgi:hypothetical protein
MRTILSLLSSTVKMNPLSLILLSMEATTPEAVSVQRAQLISGLRSDDKNIFNVKTGSDEYAPGYAKKKGKRKPIDLYDTGDFNRGVFADPRPEGILLDSGDNKSTMLQQKYGKGIFGFGTGALVDYKDAVNPVLKQLTEDALNRR